MCQNLLIIISNNEFWVQILVILALKRPKKTLPVDDRYKYKYKYMDDLTVLEAVYLMNIGIASYNLRNHIPNNIPVHNQIIKNDQLATQNYLDEIQNWTDSKKMVLNEKKTKYMIFNLSSRQT